MATITSKLPTNHKHYLNPIQNGRATWLDEVRFVEEMIANPLMLDRYGLQPYGEYLTYKMLMNYAYTVKNLRGKDVADFMFNTMRDVAIRYQQLKPNENRIHIDLLGQKHDFYKEMINECFDSYLSYGKKVCYGGKETTEDYSSKMRYHTYKPLQVRFAHRSLNCYEFLMAVRPQVFTEDIVIYKSEIDEILNVFANDLHKILIAFHVILRAKLFESSRCYWDSVPVVDETTGEVYQRNQNSDAKHWQTPLLREYDFTYIVTGECEKRSRDLKNELGIEDRRGIAKLYTSVIEEMVTVGLLENTSKLLKSDLGGYSQAKDEGVFAQEKYTGRIKYTVKDFKDGKTTMKINRSAKAYLKETSQKTMIGAYKPTFLTLHDDSKEVAFTIDYYALTSGYVYEMFEYLVKINHPSVQGCNGCKIEVCKECGSRFMIYLDGTKGRTSKYCQDCSDAKARMKRSRSKNA